MNDYTILPETEKPGELHLYHSEDVAIRLIDVRDTFEKTFSFGEQELYASGCLGEIVLIGQSVISVQPSDLVYFDPRGVVEIKPLGLLVMSEKNVLIKTERGGKTDEQRKQSVKS